MHTLPLTGAPPDHSAADNPKRAHGYFDLDKGIERPAPSAHRAPTIRSSHLLRLLSTRELAKRESVAKRAQSIRVRTNKGLKQSFLKDHWPELRPASLPVYHRTMAPLNKVVTIEQHGREQAGSREKLMLLPLKHVN